jgi:hypothetical protein
MLDRLFPKQFDNDFRGYRLGMWIFIPIILLKSVIGVNSIIMTRSVAMSADGIPLGSYSAAAAEAVIALFALLGLWQLILALFGYVALIRYRSMIPFLYLVLLLQMLGNRALNLLHPIAEAAGSGPAPGSYLSLGVLAATVFGFVLSVLDGGKSSVPIQQG